MLFGKLQRVIDTANGKHADGTAGTVYEIHVLRHEILHAIAEDRMRMAAAELHDVVVAGGMCLAPYRGGEALGQLPVAEFVDIFHCAASPAKPASSLSSPASRIMASVRSASSGETLWSA